MGSDRAGELQLDELPRDLGGRDARVRRTSSSADAGSKSRSAEETACGWRRQA